MVTPLRRSLLAAHATLPLALAVAGALAFVSIAGPALAQCWTAGPAHGQYGTSSSEAVAAGSWDPDGFGPSGPWLAVSVGPGAGPIEVWTGSEWESLPGSFNLPPVAFATYSGQLHAVGKFSNVEGPLSCVARWSGSMWEMLGSGIGGIAGDHANAAVSYGGWLIVGGSFGIPGVNDATRCAAWDGFSWVDLGGPGEIMDFAVISGQLYAAVQFGTNAGAVYRFTNPGWSRIGGMADSSVLTVEGYLGEIVAGGLFSQYEGQSASRIARWNGLEWIPLGLGATNPQGADGVLSLRVYDGQLIAEGRFDQMNGQSMGNFAAWNGLFWSGLGSGLSYDAFNSLSGLATYNGELIAVGNFNWVGGVQASNIAKWNGASWSPFMEGVNGPVRALLSTGTTLYAGGDLDFTWNGGNFNHVAGWDGSNLYNPTGLGGPAEVSGTVNAMTLHSWSHLTGPVLVVGGSFATAGGDPAANVATFDLTTTDGWGALGAGFNAPVMALASHNRTLYAAGEFTASGATALPHLARYSNGWVDPGFGSFGTMHALTVAGFDLILGGVPGALDGVSAFDGMTLTTYGTTDGPVRAFTTFEDDLIAGGSFTTIAGQTALGVARRNNATGQWTAMGQGFPGGSVRALAVHDNRLYAGGDLTSTPGSTEYGLAVWTGSEWAETCEGDGLDGAVYALASFQGKLHLGGEFQHYRDAFGAPRSSPFWIEYAHTEATAALPMLPQGPTLSASYPNPARSHSQLQYTLASAGRATLAVYDARGRKVRAVVDGWHEAGLHVALWDGRDDAGRPSAAGLYFYRLEAEGSVRSRRVVWMK